MCLHRRLDVIYIQLHLLHKTHHSGDSLFDSLKNVALFLLSVT